MLFRILIIPLLLVFLLSGLPTHAVEIKDIQSAKKVTPAKKPAIIKKTVAVIKPVKKVPLVATKKTIPKKVTQAIKPAVKSSQQTQARTSASGSYRCWSYNVSGGGSGDCRLFAPLVLKNDGTYSLSSEKGTYTISKDTISLSESKIRGVGKLIGDTQIRFEYDYNKWHHTLTYLKEAGSETSIKNPENAPAEVAVQLILQYPEKDSSLGGVLTVELVPEGEVVDTATYKPTAIAVYDGDKRIVASFYKATNMPQTGKKYTVYTSTGFSATAVGTIDLTSATKETKATIDITSNPSSEAKKEEVIQSNAPEIVVDIEIVYPAKDRSLGYINFISLVKKGEDPVTATYKPTATALWDGDKTINVSFFKSMNQVRAQVVYTVYTDTGYGLSPIGTLDLSGVSSGPMKKTILITQP